ncbi:sigma factor G inhibitor Gin [Clostridium argentinense]|nr:sigma factor G inhibitor Gin [Clostridium argentinense]ARC83237.1 sigma factor G inhibitor Gin [Clostridium argentinense]NFF41542.1 sigma factor G inhibitor Gin [Clostridium argentinense]NFP52176.1 sigma factor G inhibitor Gin [Clostridium argentinense]NFP74602.1 sigma factor G inhibitor Gin [Clostridium argentinense]NFP78785.1 sigma factor G inhibitor Gin [Clostridium argentinense]
MIKMKCIICGKPLNNGIIIYGRGICISCEHRLINSNIETDFYEFYKNCIRRSLIQFLLRGVNNECQDYHL